MEAEIYPGHRILEAMRGAPRYADAIYTLIRKAMPTNAGAVLDFGAGDGLFAQRMCADGFKVHCVEPDQRNRDQLLSISSSIFNSIETIPDQSYDFIYTVNVLEHIQNLDLYVGHLRRVLKPGGRLFVFVPAFNVLWTSLDDEVEHVQRFTRSTMLPVLKRSDLVVDAVRYFDSAGFFAALTVKGLEKIGAFRYSSETVGFYDRFLLPVSLFADSVMSKLVGKNLIVTASRR